MINMLKLWLSMYMMINIDALHLEWEKRKILVNPRRGGPTGGWEEPGGRNLTVCSLLDPSTVFFLQLITKQVYTLKFNLDACQT